MIFVVSFSVDQYQTEDVLDAFVAIAYLFHLNSSENKNLLLLMFLRLFGQTLVPEEGHGLNRDFPQSVFSVASK